VFYRTRVDDATTGNTRSHPRLLEALPDLARAVPWMSLASVPTAVERATALDDWAPGLDLWVKREDQISPVYGGNKVRRYEYVLADVLARGARRVVTAGGLGSTQVMATARFCQHLGLGCTAVLFDQPVTRFAQRAMLVDVTAGAELVYGGNYLTTALATVRARYAARDHYLILPGAAEPLATLGYLDAVLELAAQVEAGAMPRPDVMVLPTGSSGTLAALSLACAWVGWPTEVVGIRIATPWACNRLTVGQLVRATGRWVARRDARFPRDLHRKARWRLWGDALGPGYGFPTPDTVEAMPVYARWTGHAGEVTYAAKMLAGLRSMARTGHWKGKTVLLWQTLSSVEPPVDDDAASRLPASLRWALDAVPLA